MHASMIWNNSKFSLIVSYLFNHVMFISVYKFIIKLTKTFHEFQKDTTHGGQIKKDTLCTQKKKKKRTLSTKKNENNGRRNQGGIIVFPTIYLWQLLFLLYEFLACFIKILKSEIFQYIFVSFMRFLCLCISDSKIWTI